MIKSVRTDYYLNFIKDDPVRPHLPTFWRVEPGREVYVLEDDTNEVAAMICVAFCNEIPIDEGELEKYSTPADEHSAQGTNAIFYTVWSYRPGSGRTIVLGVAELIKNTMPAVKRFVTLSPMTDMARRFHLSNGAGVLQVNSTSVNYEYKFA